MIPPDVALRVIAGFFVGLLVGLTGLGGGIVLLPVLISLLGVPPILAVGSDALINFVTKLGAGALHSRRGNVSWPLVLNLALGSLPGAVLGVMLIARVHLIFGAGVNTFLRAAIGILLVVIPLGYILRPTALEHPSAAETLSAGRLRPGILAIGFVSGVIVGLTSIGSGTVVLLLLLFFYRFAPAMNVGTVIVHAVLLTGVTSLLQFRLGNVDTLLVLSLLIGSVPGGILGAHLANRLPSLRLRQLLCAFLMLFGAQILWTTLLANR